MRKYDLDINYILSGLIIYFSVVFFIDYRLSFDLNGKWLYAVAIWLLVVLYFKFKKYFDFALMVIALVLVQTAVVHLIEPLHLYYAIPQVKAWYAAVSLVKFDEIYKFVFWAYKYMFIVRGAIPHDFDLYMTVILYYTSARVIYPILRSKRYYGWILLLLVFFSAAWIIGNEISPFVYNTLFMGLVYFFIVKGASGQVNMAREINDSRSYPTGAVAFVGITISLMIILAANGAVAISQREKINNVIGKYMPSVFQLRNEYQADSNQFFNFSSTIYQTGETLGGQVTGNLWHEVMTLDTTAQGLYIKGFVSNVYDGKRWTTDNGTYFNKMNFSDDWHSKPPHIVHRATVNYTGLKSTTVFAPTGMLTTSLDYERLFSNSDQVSYYKEGIFRDSIESFDVSFTKQDYFLDESVDYLSVPESVDASVYALTLEIVEGLSSNIDKMKAIENYLRDNYVYDLNMEKTPYNQDFVSYFINEQKRGYCTYFASATAIMGRIAGVPTRYVEGYIQPTYPDRGNVYVIRSKHAHAWVESYHKGRGWLIIEGTPIVPDVDFRSENFGEDMELDALMGLTNIQEIESLMSEQSQIETEEKEAEIGIVDNIVDSGFNFIALIVILLISFAFWIINKWYRQYEKYFIKANIQKMIFRKIYYCRGLMFIVESLPNHYTFRQLLEHFEANDDIIVLIEKILYGQYQLTSSDIEPINSLIEQLETAYKEKYGRLRLMRIKYIVYEDVVNHEHLKMELKNGKLEQENTA